MHKKRVDKNTRLDQDAGPMSSSKMFHIEALEEVIETIIYTGCISDEVPVSVIFIGESGLGKSKMLSRYQSPALRPTDSISSKGLYDIAVSDTMKNEIRFLLMPDINPTLSRRPSTVDATVANLLSFTSDGTVRIDDGRDRKECKHEPVGIITSATPEIYAKQTKKWLALGLRRRIIPLFYRYTPITLSKLRQLVREDKIHSTPPQPIKMMLNKRARPAINEELSREIDSQSIVFATMLGKAQGKERTYEYGQPVGSFKWYVQNIIPIAPQITLRTLIRAHALRAGRGSASKDDFEFLLRFLGFCDPEHPREI
jgi:hypothetical protein